MLMMNDKVDDGYINNDDDDDDCHHSFIHHLSIFIILYLDSNSSESLPWMQEEWRENSST